MMVQKSLIIALITNLFIYSSFADPVVFESNEIGATSTDGNWVKTGEISRKKTDQNLELVTARQDKLHYGEIDPAEAKAFKLSTISILAAAGTAGSYLIGCSSKPSVWIYSGAAAMYLLGEAYQYNKYREESKSINSTIFVTDDKDSVDLQIDSLKGQKAQTDAALKYYKAKSGIQNLFAAGAAVASAAALIETYSFDAGACTGFNEVPQFDKIALTNAKSSIANSSEKYSLALLQDHLRLIIGENHSLSINEWNRVKTSSNITGVKAYALLALDFMIEGALASTGKNGQKAEAGGLIAGLLGTSAYMYFQTQVTLAAEWMGARNVGITRAAIFGGSALISKLGANESKNISSKYSERVNELTKLEKEAEKAFGRAVGRTMVAETSKAMDEHSIISLFDTTIPPFEAESKTKEYSTCFLQDGNIDSTCSCTKTNTCAKAKIPTTRFKGFISETGTINQSLDAMKSVSNGIATGNMGQANLGASSLLNNAKAIKKLQDDLISKISTDPEMKKRYKKFSPEWFNQFQGTMAKKHSQYGDRLLASLPGDARSNLIGLGPIKDDQSLSKKLDSKIATSPAKDSSQSNSAANVIESYKDPFADLDFDKVDKANFKKAVAKLAKDSHQNVSDEENQISNDGVNIWKVITKRYQQTAYPILFDIE